MTASICEFRQRDVTALACISHHHSTASAESSVLTALRSVSLLDVLHEYASGASVARLVRPALPPLDTSVFVTSGDEKCRLATFTIGGKVSNRAGFIGLKRGSYMVWVKYSEPTGKMCWDQLEIVVR